MSVVLLAISFFDTVILLSFYTDPPVKFLIVIILVVQEINFFYRNSGEWRLGGGGGRGLMGAQNSAPSAAVKKQWSLAAIVFHGTLLWSSSIFSLNC